MFSDNRTELRQQFFDAWQKQENNKILSPLEATICQVIAEHPEYHFIFNHIDRYLDQDYLPELGETNPFLHLSMHLGIREQVATNRPKGIRQIHQSLRTKLNSELEAEHLMMDALAETLWQAQRDNKAPDENLYLKRLKKTLKQYK
ncbi:hypothetical protein Psal006b_00938 [Piscirickettsia salmonis]|uniref:Uncharacterized protein n=1 Tax=Piscirickettsia salmonis TaxID=1238 RepID=A0A1L6TDD7_PISSA|nr:DUF1841 family protein [Piscirickettsia salmonis]AKP74477.1 hypothetical protein PSLF89_2931 [Piscirickettsia salmonis LF-89 = ATCC VR-1361]ALB23445.1 hypothetical protein KU39_2265 [Piscirickettsia salmonis]ALY03324.1 hypothetical protein AWE47_11105 [Piscirickettsia salmonis]AMA42890.1 hypothetical protein AWJ11_11335 [Piscirickettsia salmonis]AOS35358.1 hypothetical protein AVM72_08460 [Piscirickettsia salmonis]